MPTKIVPIKLSKALLDKVREIAEDNTLPIEEFLRRSIAKSVMATLLQEEYEYSNRKAWREAVLERDRSTCQDCGETDLAKLQAHHIVPIGDGGRNSLSNGACLCTQCHRDRHTSDILSVGRIEAMQNALLKYGAEANPVCGDTRELIGLNQEELANILRVSKQQVSRWENGSYSKLVEFFYWMLAAEPQVARELILAAVRFRTETKRQPLSKGEARQPAPAPESAGGVGFCG